MNADDHRWDIWCQQRGIDPNTSDETILDAFLHEREPQSFRLRAEQAYQAEYQRQMREWAAQNGVTPLRRDGRSRLRVENGKIVRDSQVDLGWRDESQCAWYAACEAFSAAYARFPLTTRRLQDRAEVVELERLYLLPSSSSG